jgi:hypothetical protein
VTPAPPTPPEAPRPVTEPAPIFTPSLAEGLSAAVGGETVALGDGGYIDNAVPRTMLRLRYDAAYRNNRPDRAEFFYAKCGCFRVEGTDPNAPGPRAIETSVDYQDITSYLEFAASERLSAFVELPVRFLNPDQNDNTAGFGDMHAGFKYAFLADPDRYLTFQLRTYIPTGDADRGLGTNHVSLEPGVLLYQRLTDRISLQGELRDWIAVDGTDFSGNVLRYGLGVSYLALERPGFRVSPVLEFVGWSVLDGKELAAASPTFAVTEDASGDTIVNAKMGVRFALGQPGDTGLMSGSDLYVGYGRALTGEVWYKDILRVELRLSY